MKTLFATLFAAIVGCAFAQPVSAANAAFQEKVLYSFCTVRNAQGVCRDGDTPEAGLIELNGNLFGTTGAGGDKNGNDRQGGGTVFKLNPSTGNEVVLHGFCRRNYGCSDGFGPAAGLIDVDGELLGTTVAGGFDGCYTACGTVFSIDRTTQTETVLYAFCKQQNCADGAGPAASLIDVSGTLYGTTSGGGSGLETGYCGDSCGTVFSLDPGTGTEKVLYSFCSQQNCTDGGTPESGLVAVNGVLYGVTRDGGNVTGQECGSFGCGVLFSVDPSTGTEKLVYSFCSQQNCTDGTEPIGGLIDMNGTLYGTTFDGGVGTACGGIGCGTVFSFDPGTGTEKVIYSFCSQQNCTDGETTMAGLINVNGTLYGTTWGGGGTACYSGFGCGIVFSLDPQTGVENAVYKFCSQKNCTDGANPAAGLIYEHGVLYGTTTSGGRNMYCSYTGQAGCGTVFALTKQ